MTETKKFRTTDLEVYVEKGKEKEGYAKILYMLRVSGVIQVIPVDHPDGPMTWLGLTVDVSEELADRLENGEYAEMLEQYEKQS